MLDLLQVHIAGVHHPKMATPFPYPNHNLVILTKVSVKQTIKVNFICSDDIIVDFYIRRRRKRTKDNKNSILGIIILTSLKVYLKLLKTTNLA